MKRYLPFAVLLSLASLLAGCGGSPSVEQVRWELQRRFPEARFVPDESVHLGRLSMGLVHGLLRMVDKDDHDEGIELVNQVRAVDFASYKVYALPDLDSLTGSTRFERQLADNGWSLMVRTREKAQRTWVYVRSDPAGSLRNLFVVSLEGQELTLVRVDGQLDRVFALAMAEHPKSVLRGGHKREVAKTAAVAEAGR